MSHRDLRPWIVHPLPGFTRWWRRMEQRVNIADGKDGKDRFSPLNLPNLTPCVWNILLKWLFSLLALVKRGSTPSPSGLQCRENGFPHERQTVMFQFNTMLVSWYLLRWNLIFLGSVKVCQPISYGNWVGGERVRSLALLKAKQPHVCVSAQLGLLVKVGILSYI